MTTELSKPHHESKDMRIVFHQMIEAFLHVALDTEKGNKMSESKIGQTIKYHLHCLDIIMVGIINCSFFIGEFQLSEHNFFVG